MAETRLCSRLRSAISNSSVFKLRLKVPRSSADLQLYDTEFQTEGKGREREERGGREEEGREGKEKVENGRRGQETGEKVREKSRGKSKG